MSCINSPSRTHRQPEPEITSHALHTFQHEPRDQVHTNTTTPLHGLRTAAKRRHASLPRGAERREPHHNPRAQEPDRPAGRQQPQLHRRQREQGEAGAGPGPGPAHEDVGLRLGARNPRLDPDLRRLGGPESHGYLDARPRKLKASALPGCPVRLLHRGVRRGHGRGRPGTQSSLDVSLLHGVVESGV